MVLLYRSQSNINNKKKGLLYLEETEHKNYASALKDKKFLVIYNIINKD